MLPAEAKEALASEVAASKQELHLFAGLRPNGEDAASSHVERAEEAEELRGYLVAHEEKTGSAVAAAIA